MSPDLKLTPAQEITARNVRTAAQFSEVPRGLSPELQRAVGKLRAGEVLTNEQIVNMVEAEVQHNSNF